MRSLRKALRRYASAPRMFYWQKRLATLGSECDLQPGSVFEYPANIHIGQACRIARHALLRANTSKHPGITLGNRVSLLENTLLNANNGSISIDDRSWLGPFSLIYGNGGVSIGKDVMIASHCAINTVSHHSGDTSRPMSDQDIYTAPVTIEDDVWLGIGSIILQGVRVGKGSIIGAGAVVTHDIPPWSVAVGTPAKVIRKRDFESVNNVTDLQPRAVSVQA
ncbi:MAG TPA: acyltransferase [Gammaproteobacteria bacterium]